MANAIIAAHRQTSQHCMAWLFFKYKINAMYRLLVERVAGLGCLDRDILVKNGIQFTRCMRNAPPLLIRPSLTYGTKPGITRMHGPISITRIIMYFNINPSRSGGGSTVSPARLRPRYASRSPSRTTNVSDDLSKATKGAPRTRQTASIERQEEERDRAEAQYVSNIRRAVAALVQGISYVYVHCLVAGVMQPPLDTKYVNALNAAARMMCNDS